jgi:hypothetical protein
MIGLESLRWSLTLAFAVATAFHGARLLRPAVCDRVSETLHTLMGGSMIVMIWPWGAGVPAGVWAVAFTFSTGWFVTRAIRAAGGRAPLMYFATAAAAMVWMSATMPAGHGHRPTSGMSEAMPAMQTPMSGTSPAADPAASAQAAPAQAADAHAASAQAADAHAASAQAADAHAASAHIASAHAGLPAWISGILGAYLVVAALWWVARGMRLAPTSPKGSTPHWTAVCHGMMSVAMGLSLLAMV